MTESEYYRVPELCCQELTS